MFILSSDGGKSSVKFYYEEQAFSGVKKIADKVRLDVFRVTGAEPDKCGDISRLGLTAVFFGTLGNSPFLEALEKSGKADFSSVRGKRETYSFSVTKNPVDGVKNAVVIAGSDKRGTIYGLFHFSGLIGVSPLVSWSDIKPLHRDRIEFSESDNFVSKEPSVRYRGFFINDEWPAFGNWANRNFGGLNAGMYENVFELLLRLKGNYLWPAMWASCFSCDGPGLAAAELADEYGVVMGCSHHEPCCRHGEEYKHVRGPDSIYGDAWNFRTNREGITKFWEDGLKRSGKFENVITVGMRGEADTAILGHDATLKDNIDLLRDVLRTQNSLIKKYVNSNLDEVPRMLALYKEVEPYFYGDAQTQGLIGSDELDGVILMLCDDNHGNLRTVPTEEMRGHRGGYGMYYHLDYHGSPFSYEWINTSYLPKVKEQMTAAYEFGVRDLWIVNVGDIVTNEFPLSFFLDLAYDYGKFGAKDFSVRTYTENWLRRQFPQFTQEQLADALFVVDGYTKLANMRRTESIQSDTFHPANFRESDRILERAEEIMSRAASLRNQIEQEMPEILPGFFIQVYYPAMGTMNVLKMQLLAGKNHWYARNGIMEANPLVRKIRDCLEFDRKLVGECDSIDGGKWYAMGWSEHIGFTNWNEEGNRKPVYETIDGADKKRLAVWIDGTDFVTNGTDWRRKTLYSNAFRNPDVNSFTVNIASAWPGKVDFRLESDKRWISFSQDEGETGGIVSVQVFVDRKILAEDAAKTAEIRVVSAPISNSKIIVPIKVDADVPCTDFPAGTFVRTADYISIEAEHFSSSFSAGSAEFRILDGYGKSLSAVKVFPQTAYFSGIETAPRLEYSFVWDKAEAVSIDFFLNPSNPATQDNLYEFAAGLNGKTQVVDVVPSNFRVGDNQEPWSSDVTDNIRIVRVRAEAVAGLNKLEVAALTPCFVLEKIVLHGDGTRLPRSYLGPEETFRV